MSLRRKALAVFAAASSLALVSTTAQAVDYYEYQNGACAPNSRCHIAFPNVLAGQYLTLSNLSCYLRFVSTNNIYGVQLLTARNTTGTILHAVTPSLHLQNYVKTSPSTLEAVFVSNDSIHAVAIAGRHFNAYAEVRNSSGSIATISQFACHISGDLIR